MEQDPEQTHEEAEVGHPEVSYARCPKCGEPFSGSDFGLLEIDRTVMGEQVRETMGVVCPSCGALAAAFTDYHRTDIVEGGSESWGRVRSIDDH